MMFSVGEAHKHKPKRCREAHYESECPKNEKMNDTGKNFEMRTGDQMHAMQGTG